MHESSNPDDLVRLRLRAVMAGDRAGAPTPESRPDERRPGGGPDDSAVRRSAVRSSSMGDEPAGGGGPRSGDWSPPIADEPSPGAAPSVPGRSARGLTGMGAFDPGRRGVKALAAVAVVVVLVAGAFAWRARPTVEAVPPVVGGAARPAAAADAPGGAAAGPPSPTTVQAEVVVAVAGRVRKPGLVRLPPGARIADALQAAGGADRGVDVALLNLARKVADGELILVGVTPSPGQLVPGAPIAAPGAGAAPVAGPINLNTATLADLDTLPGVGPVLAQRILAHREQHGGFASVADLRKVEGIGAARYEQLKELVTV